MPFDETTSIALRLPEGGTLALDLSSNVGWAYGRDCDNRPWWDTIRLAQIGGEGVRYASFQNELVPLLERLKPTAIILEATLPLMALAHFSNHRVVAQQMTLRGMAYAEAWRECCPISEIDAETVRREVIGQGRFPKGEAKRAVMWHCRKVLGWKVENDHAADACLTWEWHRRRMQGMRAGPLWSTTRTY